MKLIEKYRSMSVVSKATLWFMVCSFAQKGLSFITTPIFTRLMTREQYGLYSVYISWLQILSIFATLRLDYSVFYKGMSKYPKDRDGYASSMLGVTTGITSVLFVLYLIFHNQVNAVTDLNTIIMCALFGELYVQVAINFWSLRERYEFRYKSVILFTLFTTVMSSLLGVITVWATGGNGTAKIVASASVYIVCGLCIYILLLKRGKKFWNKEYAKFAVCFNLPLIPNYVSAYVIDQSDRIMIQKLVNFEAAALYSVAYTVGGLVRIFTSALNNTLIPLQYHMLEKKEYKALNKNMVTVMICIAGLLLAVAAGGPEVIWILGGDEYMEATSVIAPVAASVFFSFLYNMLENIELFFGKNTFAVKISSVGVLANIGLNFLCIPKFGYVAAAYTTMISYFICAVGHILYINCIISKKEQKVYVDGKILLLGIVTAICCLMVALLYDFRVLRYAVVFVIVLVVLWKHKTLLNIIKKKTGE